MIVEAVTALERLGAARGDDFASLGYVLLVAGELEAAEEAYLEAVAGGTRRPETAWYDIACARSLAGREAEALDALESALDAGFRDSGFARFGSGSGGDLR